MSARYQVRRFLNTPAHGGGAYIYAYVADTSRSKEEDPWIDVFLQISDCSRQISLDFSLDDVRSRRSSLRKARMLAQILTEFADALEAEADVVAKRTKPQRKVVAVS